MSLKALKSPSVFPSADLFYPETWKRMRPQAVAETSVLPSQCVMVSLILGIFGQKKSFKSEVKALGWWKQFSCSMFSFVWFHQRLMKKKKKGKKDTFIWYTCQITVEQFAVRDLIQHQFYFYFLSDREKGTMTSDPPSWSCVYLTSHWWWLFLSGKNPNF